MEDLDALVTAGDVIALSNTEDKDKILFPRGEPFFVELDGIITIPEIPKAVKDDPDSTKTAMNGENGDTEVKEEKTFDDKAEDKANGGQLVRREKN